MIPDDLLPALSHAAVESAGYRVARWAAAREVLHARVTKGRVAGDLGRFLTRWMPAGPLDVVAGTFGLDFDLTPEGMGLRGGEPAFVAVPQEHALLHLPALRSFWRNEMRQAHFEKLTRIVPQAWFMDDGEVPPGAVIHGLGITSFERPDRVDSDAWAAREGVLSRKMPAGTRIRATYGRDDRGRVVLRSLEAAP